MSWLTDTYDPDAEEGAQHPRWVVILQFAVALAIVFAFGVFAAPALLAENRVEPWVLGVCLVGYLAASFWLRPSVYTGESQSWELFFNNPFRIRDNFDRSLFQMSVVLIVLLIPGRIVTRGFYEFFVLLKNGF